MKKALIITYYWPPAGGIAAQRVVKFCKYLPELGWEPIILTVKNGNYENFDKSSIKDVTSIQNVYKSTSFEPHAIFRLLKKLFPNKNNTHRNSNISRRKSSIFYKISDVIRLNIFIPDARIGWLPAAYRLGKKIIEKEKPDIIFSTVPPYTAHLVAKRLKQHANLPWIADFRDPWLENINYNTSPRLEIVKALNKHLENKVLDSADRIVVVGPSFQNLYQDKLPEEKRKKCLIISNGYDEKDVPTDTVCATKVFYITYFGTPYPAVLQKTFFDAINNLCTDNHEIASNLVFRIIGKTTTEFADKLKRLLPKQNIEYLEFLPYKEALKQLYAPQLLTLFIGNVPNNDLIITGKIFDYLPTGNPILAIGPPASDVAHILNTTNSGKIFNYDAKSEIKNFIEQNYENWKSGKLNKGIKDHKQYHRRYLTEKLANIFHSVTVKA